MNGAAALRSFGVHGLLPGMKPRKSRKKGRMDVQDTGRKFLQQRMFHQSHESGQANAIHAVFLQARGNGGLGRLREFGFKPSAIDHLRRDAPGAGAFQNEGVRIVRHHHGDFRPEGTGLDGIVNGLAIGTGTGTEYS